MRMKRKMLMENHFEEQWQVVMVVLPPRVYDEQITNEKLLVF